MTLLHRGLMFPLLGAELGRNCVAAYDQADGYRVYGVAISNTTA